MTGLARRAGLSLFGPLLAVLVALVISALVIALIGEDPIAAFRVMVDLVGIAQVRQCLVDAYAQ